VVGKKISGTAEFKELAELIQIAGEGALVTAVGDAGADDFKGGIEKDDGSGAMSKEFAIGRLEKCSATEGEHRGTADAGKNTVEMTVLDGAKAAFTAGSKEFGDGAMSARDFDIEIDEGAGKLLREKASNGAFSGPHESDENQQRGWRILRQ